MWKSRGIGEGKDWGFARRMLLEVLLPGVLLSAAAVWAIRVTLRPTYEAGYLVKVELPDTVMEGQNPPIDTAVFLQTQAALVRSSTVLASALADPSVANLPSLRSARDSESTLRGLVTAEVIPNTSLIMIRAQSDQPSELPSLARAVTESYLKSAAEWDDGFVASQIKSVQDYRNELLAQARAKEQELLKLAASRDDRGTKSEMNGQVSHERRERFLVDYDAAVAARIRADSEFEAETARQAQDHSAKMRRFERIEDLSVQRNAARRTEKALLERVLAAESFSGPMELRVQLAREELSVARNKAEEANRRLEKLQLQRSTAGSASFVSDSGPNLRTVSDHRGPAALLATASIFVILMTISMVGLGRAAGTELDD